MSQERVHTEQMPTVPELWGRFVAGFAEYATDTRTQTTEAMLARRAFAAVQTGDGNGFGEAVDRLQGNLLGGRTKTFRPFASYLKAIAAEQPAYLERHALYDYSRRRLHELCDSYEGLSGEKAWRARGAANELVTSTLIARRQHPNITLIPSLHMQDASANPALNHDFLFIDRSGAEPYVQPAQIKQDASRTDGYDPGVALITASEDLHVCNFDDSSRCYGRDCIVKKTAGYLLEESPRTPDITRTLDTLTNGLLIKLSTWSAYTDQWVKVTERNRQAALQAHRKKRPAVLPAIPPPSHGGGIAEPSELAS